MRYDKDTIQSIRLICGAVLLLGQFVLQALGIAPSWLMVAAALSLMFGVPFLADLELKRRGAGERSDDDLGRGDG